MLNIVVCCVAGMLFVVLPYLVEFIYKKKNKKVPYFFQIPKPVRYITISFLIFMVLFSFGMKKEEDEFIQYYLDEEYIMDEYTTDSETTINE